MHWYDYLLLVISLALTLIIVLQNSKDDASSAFSGAKSEMAKQKQRGAQKVINQITTVLSIVFFCCRNCCSNFTKTIKSQRANKVPFLF